MAQRRQRRRTVPLRKLFRVIRSKFPRVGLLLVLGLVLLLATVCNVGLKAFPVASVSSTHEQEEEGVYQGRYPHSLLTLFYPYTLLRDVVLDQPLNETDVPVFFYQHASDGFTVKRLLGECYEVELIELEEQQAIEKARNEGIVQNIVGIPHLSPKENDKESRMLRQRSSADSKDDSQQEGSARQRLQVITTTNLRLVSELFHKDKMGRAFCFFRHPVDYELHQSLPKFSDHADNYLVRYLSDRQTGPVDLKALGVAKQVVRQACVVGTIDLFGQSVIRAAEYFGWTPTRGNGHQCVRNVVQRMGNAVPRETFLNHRTKQWKKLYRSEQFDCQLYEFIRATWRAQIQTIVPYKLQLQRAEDKDDDEEDDEDGEDAEDDDEMDDDRVDDDEVDDDEVDDDEVDDDGTEEESGDDDESEK